MKRKFEIGQKLFFIQTRFRTGVEINFEAAITKITRKYIYADGVRGKIEIETLRLVDNWEGILCFESKEAYEQNEAKIQLTNKLKYTVDFRKFTLEQLQQIEKLLESFKNT